MSKLVLSAAVATVVGLSAPAFAQAPSASQESMEQALFVAQNAGVVGINQVSFYDGKWQVQGVDPGGQNIKVFVDANTGGITYVDRWW